MKLKHTQAKKARRGVRSSGAKYDPHGSRMERHWSLGASKRRLKRELRQPKRPKTFGLHVIRTQLVFVKENRFGAPVYRTIKHAVAE